MADHRPSDRRADRRADRHSDRRRQIAGLAHDQAGILARTQLYALGLSRGEVRAEVRAGRWRPMGSHAVATFTGPLPVEARRWVAVLEGGPRAVLDGEAALVAAGLTGYEVGRTRISVPRGARIRHRGSSVDIRQTRRWSADDVEPMSRPPRTRARVAAVRAALWAVSDRQAALLLAMVVQQRLVTAEHLGVELLRVRRHRRRRFLHEVVLDLLGGVQSLGELDVVRGCRERGLPVPDTQVARRTARGTFYLDFRWGLWRVVLEVDGLHHLAAEQVVADALRHNSLALSGDVVLRLPLLGLRVAPDEFFDQLRHALIEAGWSADLAA